MVQKIHPRGVILVAIFLPSVVIFGKNQLNVLSIYIVVLAVADCGILGEFFNSFDQNTDGKLQWQIHQMILEFLKHLDQNSVWMCCCLLFFIRIPDFLKNYAAICFCVLENLRRCHQNHSKTQTTAEFLQNSSRILIRILVGNFSGNYIS